MVMVNDRDVFLYKEENAMQALYGYYKNGKIEIFGEIPKDIKRARLIIVLDPEEEEKRYILFDGFRVTPPSSEEEFKMIGLYNFFNEEDDNNIDWEECFGFK